MDQDDDGNSNVNADSDDDDVMLISLMAMIPLWEKKAIFIWLV